MSNYFFMPHPDSRDHGHLAAVFTELCERGDLANFIERLPGKRLTPGDFKSLALSVLQALRYLHLEKIIHRDIKPANILLAADGTPKLADLGVSKRLHVTRTLSSSSVHGGGMTVVGTVFFMDPHVLIFEDDEPETQHAEYGVKADVWSLGVTLCVVAPRLPPKKTHYAVPSEPLMQLHDPLRRSVSPEV